MRRIVVALLGAAVMSVSAASAADLPTKAPAFVAPVPYYNWTGFYVGADIGGGWGRHDRTVIPTGFLTEYDSSGILGGIHAGYNWQMQAIVVGLEADFKASSIKGDDGGAGGTLDETKLKWLGTVRGRIGYAWDRFLLFATGGWAYANLEHFNNAAPGQTFDTNRNGWTLGAGGQYAWTNNLSGRIEYRYYDLGTYTNGAPTNGILPYEVSNTFHTVTAGLSFKF